MEIVCTHSDDIGNDCVGLNCLDFSESRCRIISLQKSMNYKFIKSKSQNLLAACLMSRESSTHRW